MDLIDGYRELKADLTIHLNRLANKVDNLEEAKIVSIQERKAIRLEIQSLRDIVNSISNPKVTLNVYSLIQNPLILFAIIMIAFLLIFSDVVGSKSINKVIDKVTPSELLKE